MWNGDRAIEMAQAALIYNEKVHYTGFDLFEDATPETNAAELNAKRNWSLHDVWQKLNAFRQANPGFTFELVKGNTRVTLRGSLCADFVYIDGGHSVETIRNDYEATKLCPVVVFDDYYRPDADGRCCDLTKFGANAIVDEIDGAEVLPSEDPLVGGGIVCVAVVRTPPSDQPHPHEGVLVLDQGRRDEDEDRSDK